MGIIEIIKQREINSTRKKVIEETKMEFVKNLLLSNKLTIAEIARYASVNEYFVRKTKKTLK